MKKFSILNFKFSKDIDCFVPRNDGRRGFTLIELVVVIGIIGVLTALTAFNFQQARQRARDVQRKRELRQIQNSLEMYKDDQLPQKFPATATWKTDLANYLKQIPIDPTVKAGSTWEDYSYALGADDLHFTLTACLENKGDSDGSGDCAGGSDGVSYTLSQP